MTDLSFDIWNLHSKIAIVTGANTIIGASIVKVLVNQGLTVYGMGTNAKSLEALGASFFNIKNLQGSGNFHAVLMDMGDEQALVTKIEQIRVTHGSIAILVNNSAIQDISPLLGGATDCWRSVLNVNILGVTVACREVARIMTTNNLPGYIININSIVDHAASVTGMMYKASKMAVASLTEAFRRELARNHYRHVRISCISPGLVHVTEESAPVGQWTPYLYPMDVANAVYFVLSTPPHVQIQDLAIKPIVEQFVD